MRGKIKLVNGCLFARSYITFDLSPELAITEIRIVQLKRQFVEREIPATIIESTRKRVGRCWSESN